MVGNKRTSTLMFGIEIITDNDIIFFTILKQLSYIGLVISVMEMLFNLMIVERDMTITVVSSCEVLSWFLFLCGRF